MSLGLTNIILATTLWGSGSVPADQGPGKNLVTGLNEFGIGLTQRLSARSKDGNLVVSPLSAAVAHVLLLRGSRGPAQAEIRTALGLDGLNDQAIVSLTGRLQAKLCQVDGMPFSMANAVVTVGGFKPQNAYLTAIRQEFGAEAFGIASAGDFGTINKWAAEKTHDRIKNLLKSLSEQTKFVLVNAAAFDGTWETGFRASSTVNRSFVKADGTIAEVPTMARGETRTPYFQSPKASAVVLPYRDGAFSMLVALPSKGTTPNSLLANLSNGGWDSLLKELKPVSLEVWMPKFTMRSDHDLRDALQGLGMRSMFQQIDASPMLGPRGATDTFVQQDIQQAYIEADESGTKAAAATAISGGGGIGGPTVPQPKRFIVDRPFVFAIFHNTSGAIVFMGICSNPGEAAK
jgi:serine protease inhibitor